ncbi:MAG: gamma-glutamyltransferase [Gammaproteobacteria bacterium]|nr:gamma-glutamyltransferase [Gammaproteobacteria bacterium]
MIIRILMLLIFTSWLTHAGENKNPYAVASAHKLASQAGEQILRAGGNAFDAAVAISAALAVVEPYGSGIGGGGFWLLHDASSNTDVVIDGREVAPLDATDDMYFDQEGRLTGQSINGPLAAGIPGVVAALEHITLNYGRLTLEENLQPAIRFAKEGFTPGNHYLKLASLRKQALLASPEASSIFLEDGDVPKSNFIIQQTDLANTLEKIAKQGAKGFYYGEVAQKLVQGVQAAGGIWRLQDLAAYNIETRTPIKTEYHGIEIIMPPPPTSGGVVITQILAMLEQSQASLNLDDAESIHKVVEAMRRAYQDRAIYLGDPAYTDMPLNKLLNKEYAQEKFSSFSQAHASTSESLVNKLESNGEDTTHFSVLDSEGNYVAATLSINYPFGSGFVAPGTGVLLNDEMDDFSMAGGVANIWGLVGSDANAIEPGKRMLSSMTPLFARDKERTLIVGTPGGSRIISMLALALIKHQQGANAKEIVSQRRFHHQYLPDEIQFEIDALSEKERSILTSKGHQLKEMSRTYGNMHAITWYQKNNIVEAASDPRGEGLAIVE